MPRLGDPDHFDKSSSYQPYRSNQDLGVIGVRSTSTSMKGPRPIVSVGKKSSAGSEDENDQSRSRSRSAAKSTENLLVSLNESCPPIASAVNLSVERSMSVQNYVGKPSLLAGLKLTPSKSMAMDQEDILSVNVNTNNRARLKSIGKGQNEKIKVRYSTRQLISIFKGLGRF